MSLISPSSARLATCTPADSRCCSAVWSVRSSRSLRPITPFSGVRISWLMVARKSDFCREASIASSRACATSAAARSRSATRASCSATRSTIDSISSKRHSGGAEVITTTAYTSDCSSTGNAIVSCRSSQTAARASYARCASASSTSANGSSRSSSRSASACGG